MMSLNLILIAVFSATASGLAGICLPRRVLGGQRIAVLMMSGSSLLGLIGGSLSLGTHSFQVLSVPWPAMGNSLVGVDSLSAFFLIPIFLMGGLGSLYGIGYRPSFHNTENGRSLSLFWGLLVAGMSWLVISRHAMAFLLGWETMALSAFFLITTEDSKEECRRAGWIYLVATHLGTLALLAMFALWRQATGSYLFNPAADGTIRPGVMNALFFLALFGFGIKAGIVPLHFWLPGAHANAPSHVSAMLSGVMLKMGIYGLVRFLSLLPNPPYLWGGLMLLLGAVSGLLGVVFAIGQHDLKRLLAYHSVENIGIILMGLGLAMLGCSAGQPTWVVLGMAGCLLHTWNHSLFKSLLFFSAGSVVHSVHTRAIDSLGGLAKAMPWTAAMFAVGAAAICGLPPLNGFVSELFIYLGLFRSLTAGETVGSAAVIAAPVLAMIGALAVACFVKVYSAVFLGNPRTEAAGGAHESPLSMRAPMMVLAVACFGIGLAPVLLAPILDAVISNWSAGFGLPMTGVGALAPLPTVSLAGASLVIPVLLIGGLVRFRSRFSPRVGTWDCGYACPTPRIQYTASSFAQMIVAMFRWVLGPHVHRPPIDGLFPESAAMSTHVDDPVLDRMVMPVCRAVEKGFGWFRRFQQGITQHYLLYILITVILMLSTMIPFKEFINRLIVR